MQVIVVVKPGKPSVTRRVGRLHSHKSLMRIGRYHMVTLNQGFITAFNTSGLHERLIQAEKMLLDLIIVYDATLRCFVQPACRSVKNPHRELHRQKHRSL